MEASTPTSENIDISSKGKKYMAEYGEYVVSGDSIQHALWNLQQVLEFETVTSNGAPAVYAPMF